MSENIRGNIESKKPDSTKENTINAESNTLESNIDANNEARLDSNDEIVYEIWHKIGWWNGIWMTIFFLFGFFVIYCAVDGIYDPLLDAKKRISDIMSAIFFGVPICLLMIRYVIFMRRNRFYITHQGMGFERQHWFRMQRGFYRFGEVGVAMRYIPMLYFNADRRVFIICPIDFTIKAMILPQLRDKNYKYYTFCTICVDLCNNDKKPILAFIRQKTKEALESRGITISDEELKEKIRDLNYKDL